MAWQPKNLNDALFPLSTLYAILGYGVFQFPIGRPRVLFSLVYSVIILSSYVSALVYYLQFLYGNFQIQTEEKIFLILTQFYVGIAALARILGCYHRKTSLRTFKCMMKVDETLRKLGVNLNYTRDMNMGIVLIIYWLLTIISLNCSAPLSLYDGTVSIVYLFAMITILQHPVYVNIMITLTFCVTVRILETRFYELNELLLVSSKSYFRQTRDDNVWNFFRNKPKTTNWTLGMPIRRILQADNDLKSLIQTIKHVHLELINITICVDKMYGLQIALSVACFFIKYTWLMYELYYIFKHPLGDKSNFQILLNITSSFVIFANFLITNRCCDRLSAQAERTGDIIQSIDETIEDSQLSDEIRQFGLQLMNNRPCFSPAGFFTLGYPLVHGFLGAVVTYLVIIIQMRQAAAKL